MFRFVVVLAALAVASVCSAADAVPCSVDEIPIQLLDEVNKGPTLLMSDLKESKDPGGFDVFVSKVMQHLAKRLAEENICINSAEGKAQSLIQFSKWQFPMNDLERHIPGHEDRFMTFKNYSEKLMFAHGESVLEATPDGSLALRPIGDASSLTLIPSLENVHSVYGCRITSPWLDLVVQRQPIPWVRAVIRWNVRQFVSDQAVLAGASHVPSGVVLPILVNEFEGYEDEYFVGARVKKNESAMPPDLEWLFREFEENVIGKKADLSPANNAGRVEITGRLVISERGGSYSVPWTRLLVADIVKANSRKYIELNAGLIDKCLSIDGGDFKYGGIKDASDLMDLDLLSYKNN